MFLTREVLALELLVPPWHQAPSEAIPRADGRVRRTTHATRNELPIPLRGRRGKRGSEEKSMQRKARRSANERFSHFSLSIYKRMFSRSRFRAEEMFPKSSRW